MDWRNRSPEAGFDPLTHAAAVFDRHEQPAAVRAVERAHGVADFRHSRRLYRGGRGLPPAGVS